MNICSTLNNFMSHEFIRFFLLISLSAFCSNAIPKEISDNVCKLSENNIVIRTLIFVGFGCVVSYPLNQNTFKYILLCSLLLVITFEIITAT